jgi:hypothetical protein
VLTPGALGGNAVDAAQAQTEAGTKSREFLRLQVGDLKEQVVRLRVRGLSLHSLSHSDRPGVCVAASCSRWLCAVAGAAWSPLPIAAARRVEMKCALAAVLSRARWTPSHPVL